MRTLYHFRFSPYSRRVRLALAHKGLEAELRDGRAEPAYMEAARALWPMRTCPVLVEDGERPLGDSTAILHYLDTAYPERPRLWPMEGEAMRRALWTAKLVDGVLDTLIDMGTRYGELREHAAWPAVQETMLAKAQGCLNVLGTEAATRGPQPVTDLGWSAADICLFTMTLWLESLPERAKTNPQIARIVAFPWALPASLLRWAEPFRARADVIALGPVT